MSILAAICRMCPWLVFAGAGVAVAALPAQDEPGPLGRRFGMPLRPPSADIASVWAPAIVRAAPTNEAAMVARQDGSLEIYFVTKPESDSVSLIQSRDGGLTWSAPAKAFSIPGKAYYALAVLEAPDGRLHAVYHVLGAGPGGYRGRLYEVYYTSRSSAAGAWSDARRVVPGYVGAINGFIRLAKTGRLLLAVARAVPEREKPPAAGPDFGWNDTVIHFSDDNGATWRESPDRLQVELATPNVTRHGAIEPCLLELRDGRIWMLVRDRGGRLWQSFSADGERWAPLIRTAFVSSDSPADLHRLRDGRIVLLTNACQNWSNPRSYAMGGREVLHAAISADEGKTWRGFREILHERAVVARGDRGTAYASLAENKAGKLVVVSGQGEGNRAILLFDPRWLEESEVSDDLRAGPIMWTQYGAAGLRVETPATGAPVLGIVADAAGQSGASWNFPLADSGEISFRIAVPSSTAAVQLCLNDHFTRIDDAAAADHAVYRIDWTKVPAGTTRAGWHDVRLRWSAADRGGRLSVAIDDAKPVALVAQRPAQLGVNYLRVEFRAMAAGDHVRLADVAMRRLP